MTSNLRLILEKVLEEAARPLRMEVEARAYQKIAKEATAKAESLLRLINQRKKIKRAVKPQPIQPNKKNEAKRIAGTKPVQCPVEGCVEPGIRAHSNFCRRHNSSLAVDEKKKLREEQRKK